jgi:hypothetical protein
MNTAVFGGAGLSPSSPEGGGDAACSVLQGERPKVLTAFLDKREATVQRRMPPLRNCSTSKPAASLPGRQRIAQSALLGWPQVAVAMFLETVGFS